MTTRRFRSGLGSGLTLGLMAAAHAAEPLSLVTNHAVVLACTDCNVPGMSFTTFGSSMYWPMVADDGTVVFSANLVGPTITAANNRAIFQGTTPADVSVVAQSSDAAPGLPGLSLINNAGTSGISTQALRISPDGRSLWTSRLTNAGHNLPTTSDTALFAGFAGSLGLVAREGNPAPGTSGALFDDFLAPGGGNPIVTTQYDGINRNGRVVFFGALVGGDVVGSTNNIAMYTGTPGALTIALRQGQTMLPGITAAGFSGTILMIGDRLLYGLQLAGAGVTTANDDSMWLYTPGSGNALLLREGDPAPGTIGAVFSGGFYLSVNGAASNGRFEFIMSLAGGDVTPANNQAIYLADTTGAATLLARKGSPAPGTNATFSGFNGAYSYVNAAGVGIFQAGLTGGTSNSTNNNGIWGGTPGSLSLIARAGVTPIPGSNGSVCEQIASNYMTFGEFGFVQLCELTGGDVFPGRNSQSVFAWTPTKGLFLVWRAGQDLELTPGVSRPQTLAAPVGYGNSEGRGLGLSNTGKLGLTVYLDPGVSSTTVDLNCYPTTDYYRDADGDGKGDPTTEVNLCTGGTPPPGYITASGDCLDSNASALGATTETCNGIDDDCNARIDDGIPRPTGTLTLKLGKSPPYTTLSWNAVPNATHYDILYGSLQELRTSGGHYQFMTQSFCLANDFVGTSAITNTGNPSPGQGQWWLMRAIGCTGLGAYDEGVASQLSTRDLEIGASSWGCP